MAVVNVDVQIEIKSGKEVLEALTINQLTSLVGNTKQSVYSLINQKNKNNENYLDICYPFPNSDEEKESGPMFVLLNEKGRGYLEKNIKKKSRPKKIVVQEKIPQEDTKFFIEEMFDRYLCKKVVFEQNHLKLAKEIDKEFTRKQITKAFENISNSVHKKNTFSLINLDYMLRKSEIKRWSK